MKPWRRTWWHCLGALLLCLGPLRPAWSQASSTDLEAIAAAVRTMNRTLYETAGLRRLDLPTTTELQRDQLREALYQLQLQRAFLHSALARLPERESRTAVLRTFVERWSHDGLEAGLLADPAARDGLDTDVARLARHYPAPLFSWRTPLPLFRP